MAGFRSPVPFLGWSSAPEVTTTYGFSTPFPFVRMGTVAGLNITGTRDIVDVRLDVNLADAYSLGIITEVDGRVCVGLTKANGVEL